jgi:hypothetical protein
MSTTYKEVRAKHKARDAMKAAGAMQLHRIVDLEADEFCAQEGKFRAASAAADAPDLYAPAPRIPRERKASSLVGPLLGLLSILLVALVATAALVWP